MDEQIQALRAVATRAAERGRLVITGHDEPDTDSVASCVLMRALLSHWGVQAQIVLPTFAEAQAKRVMQRLGVDVLPMYAQTEATDQLVLVDHHSALHPGHVVICVDHHPTACRVEGEYVQIAPCGACAFQVYRLMERAGMKPEAALKRLAVAALYLDTVALRSEKISAQEAQWAREGAAHLGMDVQWLTAEGLQMDDLTQPPEALAMTGKKAYDFGGRRVVSTCVQTDAMTPALLGRILAVLRTAVQESGACLWVYLVHDPVNLRSVRYDITPDGRVAVTRYDTLVSRGKTVMPQVEQSLRQEAGKGDASFPI